MPTGVHTDLSRRGSTGILKVRQRPNTFYTLFNAALSIPAVAILSLFVLVLSYSLTQTPPPSPEWKAGTQRQRPPLSPQSQITPDNPPTLPELLATICDALDAVNVTHWLLPGLGLLPPRRAGFDGRFTPWQEGVDLGVFQRDLLHVILAQSSLQALGIVPVESYFGLRLFHIGGHGDARYDFRAPFVDLVYMRDEQGLVVSHCCDCAPVSISSCTKTTCGCMVCVAAGGETWPLRDVHVEGVRRSVRGPSEKGRLLLPRDLDGVDAAVFDA
ncbi:unnamed protein product [Chondrus crispus]|uniref:Uncharacterized protein n=1 Tax=Chondrus crispus TaxID=2769 RepID=R7QBM8_CHOCR|nr:unnamed protein product [Chondrus crispus]CDF34831.1 unnamed protein product [Chondrus crispus]|eukprot:XP_005714650.1 unnamed protein product [Chondrus crispus]